MIDKNNLFRKVNIIFLLVIILFASIYNIGESFALPQGATITSSSTEEASTNPPASHTAKGGSFTTLVLNVTSQTSSWKAYVGNVTGKLTLDDSNNKTIYDWELSTMQGEVYVSRNDSVNFSSLVCAIEADIISEQTALNINTNDTDSINKTFNQSTHKSFVTGGTGTITASTCLAIATYVNDQAQTVDENADFQEVLLHDGTDMVYVSLLEDATQGFDDTNYDFQIIVPDNPGSTTNTYYFYVELG